MLFHDDCDLLLAPSLPTPAFPAGQLVADSSQRSWLEWACFNWTQQAACSLPWVWRATACPSEGEIGVLPIGPQSR